MRREDIHDLGDHPCRHVTAGALARYWGLDRRVVYKWIDGGLLPAKRFPNGFIRVHVQDAVQFERVHLVAPDSIRIPHANKG